MPTPPKTTSIPSENRLSLTDEELSDLVHQLSHDIGNPLTSVVTYGSLLQQAPKLEIELSKISGYGHTISEEAWKANNLLEKFLLFLSKKNVSQKTELQVVISRLMQRYQSRYGLQSFDLEIDTNSDDELFVIADSEQLVSVLAEMLINAASAMCDYEQETGQRLDRVLSLLIVAEDDTVKINLQNISPVREMNTDELIKPMKSCNGRGKKSLGIGLSAIHNTMIRWGGDLQCKITEGLDHKTKQFSTTLIFKRAL